MTTLLAEFQDQDPHVRESAVQELARLRDARVLPALTEVLSRDPDPGVRRSAAYALGRLGDTRSVPALIASLKDEHPEVCINSIFALVQMGSEDRTQRLEALTAALAHQDLHVCRAAAVGLAILGDKSAVLPLIESLEDERFTVRSGAAFALGFLSDARAVPPLLATLNDPRPEVREIVIASLGLLGDRRAVPALRRLAAEDPSHEVRMRASQVLQKLAQTGKRK